jgi:hypothetical protein
MLRSGLKYPRPQRREVPAAAVRKRLGFVIERLRLGSTTSPRAGYAAEFQTDALPSNG